MTFSTELLMKNRHGYQADDVNLLFVTQVIVTVQSTDHVSQDGGSAAIVGERLPGTGSRNLLAGTTGGGVSVDVVFQQRGRGGSKGSCATP